MNAKPKNYKHSGYMLLLKYYREECNHAKMLQRRLNAYRLVFVVVAMIGLQLFSFSSNGSETNPTDFYHAPIVEPLIMEYDLSYLAPIPFEPISSEIICQPVSELVIEPDPLAGYEQTKTIDCIATAYDLSVRSCGKSVGSKNYGLTRSGINIANKTRLDAMCIAVDKKVIPLHSKVYIEFYDEAYSIYNGIYTALDTGSGVKGKHVDIFMGDFKSNAANEETIAFGNRDCKITILKEVTYAE